jgi:hypothetical protein
VLAPECLLPGIFIFTNLFFNQMRPRPITFFALCLILFSQCVSDNVEEKYGSNDLTEAPKGEIAWFPLNGNLNDSTGNNTLIAFAGDATYTIGLIDRGIRLDGSKNYFVISPGYLDSIAIVFWLKTPKGIISPNNPVIFDYGNGAVTASLVDGTTSATELVLKQDTVSYSSLALGEESFVNTYNNYSLVYIEVGGTSASFCYKGYLKNGNEKIISSEYTFPGYFDPATEMIYIGRASEKNEITNSYFKGNIDEIHIYNRFLTGSELEYFKNIQPE